jgi:hypothetical protein
VSGSGSGGNSRSGSIEQGSHGVIDNYEEQSSTEVRWAVTLVPVKES